MVPSWHSWSSSQLERAPIPEMVGIRARHGGFLFMSSWEIPMNWQIWQWNGKIWENHPTRWRIFPSYVWLPKGISPGYLIVAMTSWNWESFGSEKWMVFCAKNPINQWESGRSTKAHPVSTGDTLLMLHYKPIVCLSIYYDFSTSLNHANVQLKWISIYLQAPRDSLIGAWHGMIDGYLLKLEAKTLGSASKQIGPWGDMAMFNSYVKLPECTWFLVDVKNHTFRSQSVPPNRGRIPGLPWPRSTQTWEMSAVPRGNTSPFLIGTSSINGSFSIAMFNNQKIYIYNYII